MDLTIRKTLAPLGLIVAGACLTGNAHAGCPSDALSPAPKMEKESWHGKAVRMMKLGWRHREGDVAASWSIVATAEGNTGPRAPSDGVVLGAGLQQWHEDGTEFLNSSDQHPQTKNYCLGVWEKTGSFTYKLNHFAYQYDVNRNITGLVRIREVGTIDHDGERMTGVQTADAYDKVIALLTR